MKSICERFQELPQLSALRKHNDTQLKSVVQMMLLDLAEAVQVNKKFDADKVETIACCIIADFWEFRLEDLHLALRSIATGKFKIFDRLDVPVIYECLEEYRKQKSEMWEGIRDSQHLQNKACGSAERSQVTVREYWRKMTQK